MEFVGVLTFPLSVHATDRRRLLVWLLCLLYFSMFFLCAFLSLTSLCDRTDSWGCRLTPINSGNDGGSWGKDIFWCVGCDVWWFVSRNTLLVVQMFCFCGRYFKGFITGYYIYVGADIFVYGGDVSLHPRFGETPPDRCLRSQTIAARIGNGKQLSMEYRSAWLKENLAGVGITC